jgi:Mlc titration factor MtfA (ptsG expression regulator)
MKSYLSFLEGKARFTAWLVVFFVLLFSVPPLMASEMKITAKVLGIVVIVAISTALWIWRIQTVKRMQRKARVMLNLNDRFWLNQHISFYKKLSARDKIIFEDRVGLFLAEITITEVGNSAPQKSTCLYVASSAVITFWGLPYWNYGELGEVLVYPDNFNGDNSIDHKGLIAGKVDHGGLMDGTMVLSLPTLIKGFVLLDASNVGIHEFAHMLDRTDESVDGIPAFIRGEERLVWAALVDREMRRKGKHPKLNSYGFTSEEEFFAVLMEAYRENPRRIEKRYPELFAILEEHLT